jgi:hypothetical protein
VSGFGFLSATGYGIDGGDFRAKYLVVAGEARRARGDDGTYAPGVGKAEMVRRHAQEKAEKDLEQVQELESTLAVAERWTTESPKWVETVAAIKQRKYQLALNALELLIVECIFELTKMNQSETGMCRRKKRGDADELCRIQNAQTHCKSVTGAFQGGEERDRPV